MEQKPEQNKCFNKDKKGDMEFNSERNQSHTPHKISNILSEKKTASQSKKSRGRIRRKKDFEVIQPRIAYIIEGIHLLQ